MAQARLHSSPFSARNSPRGRRNDDSPSRQLQWDLERALGQLKLHEIETSKLHAYQKRQQQEDLDAQEAAQAHVHRLELNAATAQHEVVRKQAEAVLHAYIKNEAEERRRREEEAERQRLEEEERRKKAEEEARRRVEAERIAREKRETREREDRARREAEHRENERREAIRQQEKDAAERKQQEDRERANQEAAHKKQQDEEARAATAAAATKAALPTPASTSQLAPGHTQVAASSIEKQHNEYLALHKRLKTFRKEFWASARQNAALKPHVGDMRRELRTCIGKLSDDKKNNKTSTDLVKSTMIKALQELPSAPVPVNDFLPAHLNLGDNGATTVPSLVVYLLSIFSKAVIAAFVGECVVSPKSAEPIGTLIAMVFSMTEFQYARHSTSPADPSGPVPTQSLIPILMCKFHATAPILFGISGSESTAAGKLRLGWRRDIVGDANDGQRAFAPPSKHYDRLTGLGVGYTSIALRNFARAKMQNPWPPTHFWSSLAHIVNTPPKDFQTSHMLLLKNMLENNAIDRFVLFFGAAAVAALRQAVVELPKTLPREMQGRPETKALQIMVEGWKTENHFSLS
ncbi:hypothetical protein H2200_006222 [Cladophialophora chaetospira]|uniref:mRNA export factor GLE1 n=1 Tax=Cladophialophora chaetospira TaxID=386627 RepID=A0AA38XAN0_9EURO|nr:hypothetical protein H2200_006222 [Cladophialophora chaetospira]